VAGEGKEGEASKLWESVLEKFTSVKEEGKNDHLLPWEKSTNTRVGSGAGVVVFFGCSQKGSEEAS